MQPASDRRKHHQDVAIELVDSPDAENSIAWAEGKLIFDNRPLGDIVEEFNRYNTKKLKLASASLAQLQLSGVFNSHDPDSLVDYLALMRAIEVDNRPDGTRVISEK
jgi:transmembrane sensor